MKLFKCTIFAFVAVFFVIASFSDVFAQGLEGLAKSEARTANAVHSLKEIKADAMPAKLEPVSVKDSESIQEAPQALGSGYSYVLGADDIIKVTVHGESDLSSTYKIGGAGMISFPLIGEINVEGRTTRQVEKLLQDKLSNGYLINPSVSVEVASYRPFYILGEVRQPGSYDYTSGATVLKAVALAGGFTYRANKKEVQVLKTQDNGSGLYDKVSVDTSIGPGDIILVKERFF